MRVCVCVCVCVEEESLVCFGPTSTDGGRGCYGRGKQAGLAGPGRLREGASVRVGVEGCVGDLHS
jgi:hypothetical protein